MYQSKIKFPILKELLLKVNNIEGWLAQNEIIMLYNIALKACSNIKPNQFLIEIGSWKGKSTVTIGLACKKKNKGKLIAIDPHQKTLAHKIYKTSSTLLELKKNIKANKIEKFVIIEKSSSKKAYIKYKNIKSRLVFIDGDHSENQAKYDTFKWEKTVVNNGYLILHDTLNWNGPRTQFLKLLKSKSYIYLGSCLDLACFQKKEKLSLRNWFKKLYAFLTFKMFFKFFTPAYS